MKSYKIQLGVFALSAVIAFIVIIFSTPKVFSGEEIASYLSEKQDHIFTLQPIGSEAEYPVSELNPQQVDQLLNVIETSSFQKVPKDNTSTNKIPFTGTEYLILVCNQSGDYVFAMQWSEALVLIVTIEGEIDGYLQSLSHEWVSVFQELYYASQQTA